MYIKFFKRFLDIALSLLALIFLAIPMLVIALVIKTDSNGSAVFTQKRVGKNKKHFLIYKFRTMRVDAPSNKPTHLLDEPHIWITRFGKFLRKTSLDELPQIFNILKGDMSIVGPRPALWNQFDLIEERDKYSANDVRPGLTGLAQINGRDELEIPIKAKIDGEYVANISFLMDLKCFFMTFAKVIKSDGYLEGRNQEFDEEEE